jgi:CheY-like chemotaxis protein
MLRWRESSGPSVSPPKRQGFGFGVIQANIASLNGRLAFEWGNDGLQCDVAIPIGGRAISPAPSGENNDQATRSYRRSSDHRPLVLLVEDEPLVASLTKDLLIENGCEVIGPFGNEDVALRATSEMEFDAALLDLNINGRMSYPVAKVLLSRNIPFAFLTGYNVESIDAAFSQVPVLAKPVDPSLLRGYLANLPFLRRAMQADSMGEAVSPAAMTGTG